MEIWDFDGKGGMIVVEGNLDEFSSSWLFRIERKEGRGAGGGMIVVGNSKDEGYSSFD